MLIELVKSIPMREFHRAANAEGKLAALAICPLDEDWDKDTLVSVLLPTINIVAYPQRYETTANERDKVKKCMKPVPAKDPSPDALTCLLIGGSCIFGFRRQRFVRRVHA
jgi:hypothetical protein